MLRLRARERDRVWQLSGLKRQISFSQALTRPLQDLPGDLKQSDKHFNVKCENNLLKIMSVNQGG